MIRKYFVILFVLSFFSFGCAKGLNKGCKTLQGISKDMSKIYPIFCSVAEEYPDKISEEDLKIMEEIQAIILTLTNTTCSLSEITKE